MKKEDIDAVVMCTPTSTHSQIAIDAAESGKHVFVEKPIASTSDDVDLIINVAKKSGVKLMMCHFSRFFTKSYNCKKILVKMSKLHVDSFLPKKF